MEAVDEDVKKKKAPSTWHSLGKILLAIVVLFAAWAMLTTTNVFPMSNDKNQEPLTINQTPVIMFVGDSITQYGGDPRNSGFVSMFAYDYVRRADVVNRGAAGWTTRTWLQVFPQMLRDWLAKPPSLVVICLGANDAAPSNDMLHVPMNEFALNLKKMVGQIRQMFPKADILLLTPPAVNDAQTFWPRTNELTGKYAIACVSQAIALNVSHLDLWTKLQNRSDIHTDGLHLNAVGNQLVHELILRQINRDFPHLSPQHLAYMF